MSDGSIYETLSPQMMTDAYWAMADATPGAQTFLIAMGDVLMAIATVNVFAQAAHYFEYFYGKDRKRVVIGVVKGLIINLAHFVTSFFFLHQWINNCFSDIVYSAGLSLQYERILLAFTAGACLVANLYFSRKIWLLSGKKIYLGVILGILVCANTGAYAYAIAKMAMIPMPNLRNLGLVAQFNDSFQNIGVAVAALNSAYETFVCAAMLFFLFKDQHSLFRLQRGLTRKLVSVCFESMFPPALNVFLLAIAFLPRNDLHTWTVLFMPCLGPLYFHAILFSLVSRKTIRDLVDHNLTSQGVDRLGSSTNFASKQSVQVPVHVTVDKVYLEQNSPSFKKPSVNRDQDTQDIATMGWNTWNADTPPQPFRSRSFDRLSDHEVVVKERSDLV